MMKIHFSVGFLFVLFTSTAGAALEPNEVREALAKKTDSYLKEGLVSGGDREIRSGIVKDIRRATNGGFERIVVDIDSEKAPYYQASIDPTQKRILVTVFGSPKLAIQAKKIVDQFRKSALVARVEFFPLIEEDSWTFALYLRTVVPVEVFELSAPTRIILDLKGGSALVGELAPKEKAAPTFRAAKKLPAGGAHSVRVPPKPKPIQMHSDDETGDGNAASNHSDDIPE